MTDDMQCDKLQVCVVVNNLDEAISVAKKIPGGRWGTVEIRPVMEIEGLPTN